MDVLGVVNQRKHSAVRNLVIRHPRKSGMYIGKFQWASFKITVVTSST